MALNTYIAQIQRLLHDPNGAIYAPTDLTLYINEARAQIAAEAACIRFIATLPTSASQQSYLFPSINVSSVVGAASVLVVRKVSYAETGTAIPIRGRPWEWFFDFCISNPATGTPSTWSTLSLGSSGQLYLYPIPDAAASALLDCVLLPIDLLDDSTVEAIPYPWTDCIQYFAAYLAYQNAQRNGDADRMWSLYQKFSLRGRDLSTPSTMPRNFPLSSQPSGIPSVTAAPFPGGKSGVK